MEPASQIHPFEDGTPNWSLGTNFHRIVKGDRFYLMQVRPKAGSRVIASGVIESNPYPDESYKGDGSVAQYADISYDWQDREGFPAPWRGQWVGRASGAEIPERFHKILRQKAQADKSRNRGMMRGKPSSSRERKTLVSSEEAEYLEGRRRLAEIELVSRNPAARRACIARHGTACAACGFDFGSFYDLVGEGFCEVHHIEGLSKSKGTRRVDPIKDLKPVCANCHRMLHRGVEKCRSIAALKKIIEDARRKRRRK